MGKKIEIECTADIYIDEYVEDISDDVLFEEALSRLNNTTIVDLIASSYNLNIIQVSKLKQFLEELL